MEQKINHKDVAKTGAWRRWIKRAGQTIALGMLKGMATAAGGLVVTGVVMWVGLK